MEQAGDALSMTCAGILIYPTNGPDVSAFYTFEGHRLRIVNLNLDADWREIDAQLRGGIEPA